ncbi:hypothetical protein [Haloferula sp. A504]|uniref:hypothetical protein n=1 Tax=Haloferula sp. A504 TaxID=3373601 RepID=UPI0031CB227E|nr:hypothetical protein [Verrucomicrobiaceae bacterium E54]
MRGTSRASNDGWYSNPLDLDLQLHVRVDGDRVESRLFHAPTAAWSAAPDLDESLFRDPSEVPAYAEQLLALARKAGVQALGIVLHVADEFATTEIKPELDNPGALAELREAIITTPGEVLDDSSLSTDDHSWRLLPYPAAGSDSIATAIILSRHAAPFIEALREFGIAKNFPFVTLSVSAPLVALLALPKLKTDAVTAPFLAVLPYPVFTVLAFFNEHGDLLLLRTLQHRGQRRPSNLRHAAATTAAAMEMADPDIHILPLAGEPDPQLAADLRIVFEGSNIHEVDWRETDYHNSDAQVSVEMVISTKLREEVDTPLAASHTFSTLGSEGWAIQDFIPVPAEVAEVYPSRMEMKMLRTARWVRFGLIGAVVLCFGWIGLRLLDMVRQPEWTFNETEAQGVAGKLSALRKEQQRIAHWDNLLEDRSKAWTSMEMLARFFPERSGFLVRTFHHSANPENVPGQAKLGFVKQWRINGLAREDSLEKLADLNTREGISAAFTEIARVTGNQAFRTDLPTRSIIVNIKTLENAGYKPKPPEEVIMTDESSYPFLFDLTITQRFEADDPLAVSSSTTP